MFVRGRCIDHAHDRFDVSERRVSRVLVRHLPTQRHIPRGRADEERLAADMTKLACQCDRYHCIARRVFVERRLALSYNVFSADLS